MARLTGFQGEETVQGFTAIDLWINPTLDQSHLANWQKNHEPTEDKKELA